MDQRFSYWLDVFLAVVFGALAAGAVWLFQQTLALSEIIMPSLHGFLIALVPAFGGLLVGLISYLSKIEASGDLLDIIAGTNLKRRILSRPRNIIKPFLSAISIASGNPVGSQMSTVMLGSQAAAFTSTFLNIPRRRTRLLIACGAAAGFSAAFGSPLAAVAFVIEVILSEFTTYGFVLVATASGSGYIFSRLIGLGIPFSNIKVADTHWLDMTAAVLIGFLCPVIAFGWQKMIDLIESKTHKLPFASLWGPMAAGLVAGVIMIFYPGITGPGYKIMEMMSTGGLAWALVLGLMIAKMISTSAVLGLHGAGGDFAPALFLGASTGSLVSTVLGSNPGPGVIVGATALLSSVMHAPLTGILLSFEIVGTKAALLPVTIGVVVSSLVTMRLTPTPQYQQKAHEKGIILPKTQFQETHETAIGEVMTRKVIAVEKHETVKKAIDTMRDHGLSGLVITDKKKIFGIITLSDLRNKVTGNDLDKKIADFCQTEVVTGTRDTTLSQAWEMMRENQIGRIPIISKNGTIAGIVTKRDLLELATRKTHEEDR